MAVNKYTNTASTASLVDPVTSTATSITVSGFTGWPGATPYWAEIAKGTASAEIVQVTGVTGSTLTVARGQDGTAASSHNAGDKVEHVIPAYLPNLAESHADATTAHGTSSALVGVSDTGTLTGKTYQGAHTHIFSDANPASATAGYKSTADSAAARDGFVHENASGDVNRAAFRATQVGADRFAVFNDGTVKITPAGTATRAALDVTGKLSVTGTANVTSDVTLGGALSVANTATVAGVDMPAPAAGATTPRLVVRTQAGQDGIQVVDGSGRTRFRATDTAVHADGDGTTRNVELRDGVNVKLADGTGNSWLWHDRVQFTQGANTSYMHHYADGVLALQPAGPRVSAWKPIQLVTDGVVEGWLNLSLLAGWTVRSGYHAPAVRWMPDGTILFRGGLSSGTTTNGTTIAVLDAKYRPKATVMMAVPLVAAPGSWLPRVSIATNGNISIWDVTGDFAIDGLSVDITS